MATVSKYANSHTAITGGYTNPSNAYVTGDSAYATAAPAKNSEISAYWNFAAFGTGDIPDGAVINSVTVKHVYKVSTNSSIANEYIQVFKSTTGQGSEQNDATEPLSDTERSHQVTSGIALSDLRSAGTVRARTRSARGNSSTAVTFSIEYVQIIVDYSTSTAHTKDLSDSVTASESLSSERGIETSLSDSITASDNRTSESVIERSLSDTATASDNRTSESVIQRSLSDSVTPSDDRTFGKEVTLTDIVTASDNNTRESGKEISLSDSVTPSDNRTFQTGIEKILTDSVTASDSRSTEQVIQRSLSDSVTPSENITQQKEIFRTIADSVTPSDSRSTEKGIEKSLADSVTPSESFEWDISKELVIADSVTASDSRSIVSAISKSLADSVTASESTAFQSAIQRVLSDSILANDAEWHLAPGSMSQRVSALAQRIGQEIKSLASAFSSHNHNSLYEAIITKSIGYLRWTGSAWEFKNETYSLSSHNHDGTYELLITKSTGYLKWNGSAWVFVNETYSLSSHNHSGVYEPAITKSTGYLTWNGSAFVWKNETYALNSHDHSGVYEPVLTTNQRAAITGAASPSALNVFATMADVAAAGGDDKTVKATSGDTSPGYLDAKVDNVTVEISGNKIQVKANVFAAYSHNHDSAYEAKITKTTGYLRWTGTVWEFKNETYALSSHNHDSTYEALITKSAGYLKWTGSAWQFVNETYLTGITKAMVEAVLTGAITSHTHSYEPVISKSTGYLRWTGSVWEFKNETYALSSHNHDSAYEALITKSTGYLKWNGSAWQFVNETYSLSSHNHSGVYEPAFSKNTAFNKNFGTGSGTVCEGNDSRLSDNRTPSDTSVTYAKLATDLTQRVAVSAADIDWSTGGVYTKAMSTGTTFTFSNLKLNKTITLVLSGNYTVALPSYCKKISGTYDGSTTNYIQFHCTNAGSGTEEVWYTISKQAS